MYRGSRKHVLDWTDHPDFPGAFRELLGDLPVEFGHDALWMPRGHGAPREGRLDTFGPVWRPGETIWEELSSWWLVHRRGANTPNWDILVGCRLEGRPGLVLVEAKANQPELSTSGKPLRADASPRSRENDSQIRGAIADASKGWKELDGRFNLEADSHYQLANRLAFTWKLATLGVPTALVYLGFTGDEGIEDVGGRFLDDQHWRECFTAHAGSTMPVELLDRRLDLGRSPAWVLCRSRVVLEVSLSRTGQVLR